jgi:hypothetical protein
MRGNVEYIVLDSLGAAHRMYFDRVEYEQLRVRFHVRSKTPSFPIDQSKIKTDLVSSLEMKINSEIDKNLINVLLTRANPNLIYSSIEESLGGVDWSDMVHNSNLNFKFVLSTENIEILL